MARLGEAWECEETVELPADYSAEHLARRGRRILSTPCLVLALERVARKCLDSRAGIVSVGYRVDVKHRRSLELPGKLRVYARVFYWDGRRALVYVRGETPAGELVGEMVNERFKLELED